MLPQLLPASVEGLLREERALLRRLRGILVHLHASTAQQQTLEDSIAQLDEPFLLIVVGEFNAGKSAFINALVGQSILKEGVTPTTALITLLEHGDALQQAVMDTKILTVKAPAEILRNIRIVDTPGTNAIIREHETLTSEFVPRADLVFFVTSAERPFSETERAFMERIRTWGKKIVVVVNKDDLLETAEQREEVRSFVADNARRLLGFEPEIFFVSARSAIREKQGEPVKEASGSARSSATWRQHSTRGAVRASSC